MNVARYLFLDPHSRGFFVDWNAVADDTVGALRMQAGRNVRDRTLSDLIGELSTRSDEFADRVGPAECTAAPHHPQTTPQPSRRGYRADRQRPRTAGR